VRTDFDPSALLVSIAMWEKRLRTEAAKAGTELGTSVDSAVQALRGHQVARLRIRSITKGRYSPTRLLQHFGSGALGAPPWDPVRVRIADSSTDTAKIAANAFSGKNPPRAG